MGKGFVEKVKRERVLKTKYQLNNWVSKEKTAQAEEAMCTESWQNEITWHSEQGQSVKGWSTGHGTS